jgi:hypothetical protein
MRAVAAHKTMERDACYRPRSADARNQPVQIGEHLAANHVAQMRCIRESRQDRLGIQIAARVRQASLNAGSDCRRSRASASLWPQRIAAIQAQEQRAWRLGCCGRDGFRNQCSAASALYTTLVSCSDEISRLRGANPSLFRYYLKEWPFASYCLPLALRSPPPAGFTWQYPQALPSLAA